MYSTVKKPHHEIFISPTVWREGSSHMLVNAVFMATKFAGDVYDYRCARI